MNCPADPTQCFPGADPAAEDVGQLFCRELIERVAGMNNDCQAVNGDDVFGFRAFQVTQRLKLDQFSVFDGA